MLKLVRTDSKHKDFAILVVQLNSYLKIVDGKDHAFYMQFNSIETLNNVVLAYMNNKPVGCGAFKTFDIENVEIKRMFTHQQYRKKSIATSILKELELWANELDYKSCVLETGKKQLEAVTFYKKNKYQVIKNFGQYKEVDNSICFQKKLTNEKR